MKLLSLKEIKMFNYEKTRENVIDYIKDINIVLYKYRNVLPPSISQNLFDIKIQSSGIPKSSIEMYVEKKDEYERLYKEKMEAIESIISQMSPIEQRFFKEHFIHGTKLEMFEIELRCGSRVIDHIKHSSVIKFALSLDIAVYK